MNSEKHSEDRVGLVIPSSQCRVEIYDLTDEDARNDSELRDKAVEMSLAIGAIREYLRRITKYAEESASPDTIAARDRIRADITNILFEQHDLGSVLE